MAKLVTYQSLCTRRAVMAAASEKWSAIMEDMEVYVHFSPHFPCFLVRWALMLSLEPLLFFKKPSIFAPCVLLIGHQQLEDPKRPLFRANARGDALHEGDCVFHQSFFYCSSKLWKSFALGKSSKFKTIVSPDSELDHTPPSAREWEWPYHSHRTADLFAKNIYKSCIIHAQMLMWQVSGVGGFMAGASII